MAGFFDMSGDGGGGFDWINDFAADRRDITGYNYRGFFEDPTASNTIDTSHVAQPVAAAPKAVIPMNENVDPIDQQLDVNTGGFMDDVGDTVLDALPGTLNALNYRLAGGNVSRMPYDPSNPNFSAVRAPQRSANSGGLLSNPLVLILIAVVLFK